VIGLVQIGSQQMADRYTYWPLNGLFLAAVWGLHSRLRDPERSGPLLALPVLGLILALALGAWLQAASWRDTVSLWSQAIAVDERNYRAHNNLGAALGPLGRYDEAEAHFRKALEYFPDYASAHGNLGKVLELQDRFAEAESHFRQAVQLDPELLSAQVNWGIALGRRGRHREAVEHFRRALEIEPGNPMVRAMLDQAESALASGEP
jgi:tetratricopeptide (TPR) repeat protein